MRWPDLVLASASPRRVELLRAIGIEPRVHVPPDGAEGPWIGESPRDHAIAQATAKASAVAPLVKADYVLAADTVVVIDGRVLGKPVDAAEAARMLRTLSGRAHEVMTAVALAPGGGKTPVFAEVETTTVYFEDIDDAEIAAYVATGEPLDKAGGYAIQGRAGVFVRKIDGCYFNVVGLPTPRLYRMVRALSRS